MTGWRIGYGLAPEPIIGAMMKLQSHSTSNPTSIAQWESYGEVGQQRLLDNIPTRRLGKAEDIANGVRFFVSPDASWVSGQTLSIDGGHALF